MTRAKPSFNPETDARRHRRVHTGLLVDSFGAMDSPLPYVHHLWGRSRAWPDIASRGSIDVKYDYDLVCIGSGPAGQRAAVQAAKLGKRVAVVERQRVVGGVCVATGTIPSKTFREAVLALSGSSSAVETKSDCNSMSCVQGGV